MTISPESLLFYAGGMFLLFIVPGPVWVALTARALSGGFASAWPLAVGVALGDLLWPLAAIFGLTWILSVYGDFLSVLRYVAGVTFCIMGGLLIRSARRPISANNRMTTPGRMAGFLTGVAAVFGNPKAVLFYMGVLPGFFDLTRVNGWDIAAILAVSVAVPLIGNLILALSIDRARRLLASPDRIARINLVSGVLLIAVGVVIGFS